MVKALTPPWTPAFAGVTAILLLAGCHKAPKAGPTGAIQEVDGFAMTRSRAGVIDWVLNSPHAVLDEGASSAHLVTPRMEVFQDGREETSVRANEGAMDLATQDTTLTGSVVVVAKTEHSTLKTEQLNYIASAREFRTEQPVEIRRPDGVVHGRGLTASHDLSVIHVHQQETRGL